MKHRAPLLAVNAALAVYPFAVYFAESHVSGGLLLAGFLLLAALRLAAVAVLRPSLRAAMVGAAIVCAGGAVALASIDGLSQNDVRLYPIAINVALFAAFFGSVFTRQPLVERLARLTDPELPPAAVRYTRRVNWVWCGVTLFNVAAATYTALFAPLRVWSLYNGLLVYLLIGAVAGVELIVRRHYRRARGLLP